MAPRHECRVVPVAVNQVGAEQPTEEHDLGQQEEPHAERGGLLLLLQIREVVPQIWRMFVFRLLLLGMSCDRLAIQQFAPRVWSYSPATRSRRPRSRSPASLRSSSSEEATESATRGP